MDGHDGRQRSISFEVSVQTTVSKLHMELDRPAHWRTEPGGGEPRTLTSGAPIPEPAARPATAQPRSPARYATHQKLEFLRLDAIFAPSPFVAQACSGALTAPVDASIHLLGGFFSVWLDRVASSRNLIKTIDFS